MVKFWVYRFYIDGLVQERHNSSALAMELCLSCINPSICNWVEKILLFYNWIIASFEL